jgi:hypothetical protein
MKTFRPAILFVVLVSLAGSGVTSVVATSTLKLTYALLPTYTESPTYTSIPNKSCIAFTSIFWHNYKDDHRYQ